MKNEKVIATYYAGAFGLGIEIFGIEYGIEDYIIYRWMNSSKKTRAKIRYTNKGKAYFVSFGKRIPLDECIRV